MWKLALLAVGLAALYTKQKAQELFQGLTFEPKDVHFSKNTLGLLSTRFILDLSVYNKSDITVPITSVAGTVAFNSTLLASFNVTRSVSIKAKSTIIMPIEVTADNQGMLSWVKSIVTGKALPPLTMKGIVKTPFAPVPFEEVYDKIPLPI